MKYPEKRKTKDCLLIWDLPKGLKARFKSACAKKRTKMKLAIVEFMQSFSNA